jgi:hypothetical protein
MDTNFLPQSTLKAQSFSQLGVLGERSFQSEPIRLRSGQAFSERLAFVHKAIKMAFL